MRTPPRDFRVATYKFAGVEPGYLPHDDDLGELINVGLEGTVMLDWNLSPESTNALVMPREGGFGSGRVASKKTPSSGSSSMAFSAERISSCMGSCSTPKDQP